MSIFDYQSAIRITFDQPIATDPEIITGTEFYLMPIPPSIPWTAISSGDAGGTTRDMVHDRNTATHWQANTSTAPVWIGKDFGVPVTLTRIGVQMDSGAGRINAYEIQGSSDGIVWHTVAAGNFVNASGEQLATFPAATYRFWRVLALSRFSSLFAVTELFYYGTRNVYNVAAWLVTGWEHRYQPGGDVLAETYTVRRVTKAPDNMSVTLWLSMFDRMTDPAGLVTVSYNKVLGNLAGDFDAYVESFTLQFTPTHLVPYSQPSAYERLTMHTRMTISVLEVVHRFIPAESDTFLIPDQDNPHMDEHLSVSAMMTVVVTQVGGLPL